MLDLDEHGALTERFVNTKPEGDLDPSVLSATRDNLQYLTEEGNKRGIQVLMGMGDAQNLGGGLRGLNSVAAALKNLEKQKKKEEREGEIQLLQALLDQLAAVDAEITGLRDQIKELDDKINVLRDVMQGLADGTLDLEDALSKPEVAEAIREWERRNPGKKFDRDAEGAKGELYDILAVQSGIYVDRRSDIERQLDAAVDRQKDIVSRIGDIDSNLALSLKQKRAEASEISGQGFSEAFTVSDVTTTQEIAADANTQENGFRDASSNALVSSSESDDFLGSAFGDDSALDFASADFGNQFASATQPAAAESETHQSLDKTPKIETGIG